MQPKQRFMSENQCSGSLAPESIKAIRDRETKTKISLARRSSFVWKRCDQRNSTAWAGTTLCTRVWIDASCMRLGQIFGDWQHCCTALDRPGEPWREAYLLRMVQDRRPAIGFQKLVVGECILHHFGSGLLRSVHLRMCGQSKASAAMRAWVC